MDWGAPLALAAVGTALLTLPSVPQVDRFAQRAVRSSRSLGLCFRVAGGALAVAAITNLAAGHSQLADATTVLACFVLIATAVAACFMQRSPVRSTPVQRVLAVGAHPDDIELACGATLARLVDEGHQVRVIIMSRGGVGGDGAARVQEAIRGSRYLGAIETKVHSFDDTRLSDFELSMVRVVEREIVEFQPHVLLTHSAHDTHQDHVAVHNSCIRGARRIRTFLCFESPSVTRDFNPSLFVDVSGYLGVKAHAINLHGDQRTKPYMASSFTTSGARFRGRQGRMEEAEGFEVVRVEGFSEMAG